MSNKKLFLEIVDSELTAAIAAAGAAGAVDLIRRRGVIRAAWETLKPRTRRAVVRYMMCRNHRGKMTGLYSLSTSCELNPECIRRHSGNVGICGHCYSFDINANNPALSWKLKRNTAILTSVVLTPDDIPGDIFPPSGQLRFESFGDLLPGAAGAVQWLNYRTIAARLSHLRCAAWTKHPATTATARPVNLALVWSITAINCRPAVIAAVVDAAARLSRDQGRPDTIFLTVDDNAPAWAVVTCGRRACDRQKGVCGGCYSGHSFPVVVVEKVKKLTV